MRDDFRVLICSRFTALELHVLGLELTVSGLSSINLVSTVVIGRNDLRQPNRHPGAHMPCDPSKAWYVIPGTIYLDPGKAPAIPMETL